MENRFQYNIATGRITLPIAIIISLSIFALCYNSISNLISLAIAGAITYMLMEFNAIFAFIRTRTFLPSAMFLLFYIGCPSLLEYHSWLFIPLLFMVSLFSLFQTYEKRNCSFSIFHAFLFLGIAGLISPYMLYFTPFMYIYMISLRSLNPRSFFAGILGIITPYVIMASYYIFTERTADIYQFFAPVIEHPVMANFYLIPYEDALYYSVILLIGIVSSIMNAMYSYKDKVKGRIIMRTIILIEVTVVAAIFVLPILFAPAMVIQLITASIMSGHLFALEFNKVTRIYLMSIIVLFILSASLNVWIHWFNS